MNNWKLFVHTIVELAENSYFYKEQLKILLTDEFDQLEILRNNLNHRTDLFHSVDDVIKFLYVNKSKYEEKLVDYRTGGK